MQQITDEQMQQMLMTTKEYTLVLLKSVRGVEKENLPQLLWEHGRRNFALRAEGIMPIVAPVTIESEIAGICIFDTDANRAREIMEHDPAVQEGIFTIEVLPIRSFPGDNLPE